MNAIHEYILLKKMHESDYNVSFMSSIPDSVELITQDWFDKNVINYGSKKLDLITLISIWNSSYEEYNLTRYKDLRKSAYPSIVDQLDMIYWDKINGTSKWSDAITSIKQKYPKGQ